MLIKYNAYRALTQKIVAFAICMLAFNGMSQIIGGENQPDEEKKDEKEKKEKVEREPMDRDSLSGTTYYLTGLFNYGHRSFMDNSPFQSFTDWEMQTADYAGGFNFGVFLPLNNWLTLDLGFTYFGHKEQMDNPMDGIDSSYYFSQTYRYIGVPLKLRFNYGKKLEVFGFVGVTPLNLINVRFEEVYRNADGDLIEPDPETIKDKLGIFNVMGNVGFGLTYNFDWVGLTVWPEYRHHLLQTWDAQRPMSHKQFGLGINAGLTLRF